MQSSPTTSTAAVGQDQSHRSATRIALSVASFGIAFIAALAVWNVALGVLVGKHPGWRKDPDMGRVPKAGTLIESDEGFAKTHINSLGMRNPEIGPKVPGKKRVLCLGDSFTAGLQVSDGETYVDRLRQKLGDGYEIINGGRDGANPAYYIALGPYYREKIEPDLVVVEIFQLNLRSQMTSPDSNFYVEKTPAGDYRLVRNLDFVSNNAFTRKFSKFNALISMPAFKIGAENVSRMLKPAAKPKASSGKRTAPPELCTWTVRELHKQYPNLVLFYIGGTSYYDATPPADEIATYLESEAKREGVPFVAMDPQFRSHFETTREMSHGFSNSDPGTGHVNGTGHRVIADTLAPIIERMP